MNHALLVVATGFTTCVAIYAYFGEYWRQWRDIKHTQTAPPYCIRCGAPHTGQCKRGDK